MTQREKLKAEFPIGTEIYVVRSDTILTVESWEPDDSSLTGVRSTYRASGIRYEDTEDGPAGHYSDEERTERWRIPVDSMLENGIVRADNLQMLRMVQRRQWGFAFDDPPR
jgi:hypothetical protein